MAVEPNAATAICVERTRSFALSLVVALGELASVVSSAPGRDVSAKAFVPDSYCNFFEVLLELAHSMSAKLCDLVARKMVLNRLKYPAAICMVSLMSPY